MDELNGLLTELDAPPEAVWTRVLANALDPAATHQDLADLVPDPGELDAVAVGGEDMFIDDPDEDDSAAQPDIWVDDLEIERDDLGGRFFEADVTEPHPDEGSHEQDPDVS